MNGITPDEAQGEAGGWVLDWEAFEKVTHNMGLTNNARRAEALDMSHTSLSKIRSKKMRPGGKFIKATATIGIPFNAIFVRSEKAAN